MTQTLLEGLRYIGVDDLNLDLFESQYAVPEGMAYNSYLIEDKKIAILDTADARCSEQWKRNLSEALSGRKPDYLVVHHMEPDHSALIADTLAAWPELKLVTTDKAAAMLGQFFEGLELEGRLIKVKEGDSLSLGRRSLHFYLAPMVHWPEVMVSWLDGSGALFSADAFGKFGALQTCGFWGDEDDDWACEGRRYYFNICGKYGGPVQTLLKKLEGLDIKMICPLHGPILRKDLGYYLDLYRTWSSYGVETPGVFVAYASIHGGTAEAALRLADILKEKGCPKVATADLTRDDMGEAVEDAFRYGKMVLAAASYDAGLFTPAWNFLHLLQAKAWQKRTVALVENGSWAPSAARVMREMFAQMKDVTVLEPAVTIRSRMKKSDIPALEALADAILNA
ncbi:MAG: MBL fold metallo-hydrolase [Bacteroidales bacterium]|nr:MBL fold metallo-hydrolase [Bacteroidales bacterium]